MVRGEGRFETIPVIKVDWEKSAEIRLIWGYTVTGREEEKV